MQKYVKNGKINKNLANKVANNNYKMNAVYYFTGYNTNIVI